MERCLGSFWVAITIVVVSGSDNAASAAQPTAAEIAAAIAQLGDDSFQRREDATQFLWQAGEAATPALREAQAGDDPEVTVRAGAILEKLRYGLFPDSPAEVVQLVAIYRRDARQRADVRRKLATGRHFRTLLALIADEPDRDKHDAWMGEFSDAARGAAVEQIAAGDLEQAGQLLRASATRDGNVRHWAAFLAQTGQAAREIDKLRALGEHGTPHQRIQLALLLRATGDLAGAGDAADALDDTTLKLKLWHEAGQWEKLSQRLLDPAAAVAWWTGDERPDLLDDLKKHADTFAAGPIERLGYAAAWHRLANREDEAQRLLKQIEQDAAGEDETQPHLAALLINDDLERGWRLLKHRPAAERFDVCVYRHEFRAALAHAGVLEIGSPYERWFEGLADGLHVQVDKPDDAARRAAQRQFQDGLLVVEQLDALGEKEAALRLVDHLIESAKHADPQHQLRALAVKFAVGQRAVALTSVAPLLLDSARRQSWFMQCYGREQAGAAAAVWRVLEERHGKSLKTAEGLAQVDHLLHTAEHAQTSPEEWAKWVEESLRLTSTVEPLRATSDGILPARAWQRRGLAELCRLRGDAACERLVREAASADEADRSALGEFYLRQQDWPRAAALYAKLSGEKPRDADRLYCWGYALAQQGDEVGGKRKMELALLLPLADGGMRSDLVVLCNRLELPQQAREQCRLAALTDEPHGPLQCNVAAAWGNWIVEEDPLLSAHLWQHQLLRTLGGGTLNRSSAYLKLPYLVHKLRGKGLLAKGDVEQAWREIELARHACPAQITLAIDLVPLLEAADQRERAALLFEQVYAANERVVNDFPRSADHHHRLAMLGVKCSRRSDDARAHAERAVALAPHNDDYRQTLAETRAARPRGTDETQVPNR